MSITFVASIRKSVATINRRLFHLEVSMTLVISIWWFRTALSFVVASETNLTIAGSRGIFFRWTITTTTCSHRISTWSDVLINSLILIRHTWLSVLRNREVASRPTTSPWLFSKTVIVRRTTRRTVPPWLSVKRTILTAFITRSTRLQVICHPTFSLVIALHYSKRSHASSGR